MFSFTAADDTGEARFFAYDTAAYMIIHRSAETVLRKAKKASDLPQELIDTIGKKFTFSVGVTNETLRSTDTKNYQVKSVFVDYEQQAHRTRYLLTSQPQTSNQLSVTTLSPVNVQTSTTVSTTNLLNK